MLRLKRLLVKKDAKYYIKLYSDFLDAFNDKFSLSYIEFMNSCSTKDLLFLLAKCVPREHTLDSGEKIRLGFLQGELGDTLKAKTPEQFKELERLMLKHTSSGVNNAEIVRFIIKPEIDRRIQSKNMYAVVLASIVGALSSIVFTKLLTA